MQTHIFVPTLCALAAAPLLAWQAAPQLACQDHRSSNHQATFCEMREQTLPASGTLSVDSRQNGGISLKGWDRAEILVRARVDTAAPSDAEARDLARQIRIETAGNQVGAAGPAGNRDHHWSVTYEVFAPHQIQASLATVNGGIQMADLNGRLDFAAVNGGVHLSHLAGSVKGHTVNGGLHIELSGNRWSGEGMDVRTTNGGVHITVPDAYSAHLEVGTTNGGFHLGIPVTVQGRLDRIVSTNLGSGGATVRAITTNGGVTVGR